MFPSFPQGTLQLPSVLGPPNCDWSQQIDYQGGSSPIYILWAPTSVGALAGVGFIQKFTYSGSSVTVIQWAVAASGQGANPTALWSNRTTLTYA